MATSGLSYDNRFSPSGFALGIGTVINDNSSVLWINYYICVSVVGQNAHAELWAKHAHAQSKFGAVKTPVLFITTITLEQL